MLPFWIGEPDEPTPDFIRKAGTDSIAAGELFYTHTFGIAELREALAAYISRLHRKTDANQIAVTTAGVNALMIASQLLVDPRDRVAYSSICREHALDDYEMEAYIDGDIFHADGVVGRDGCCSARHRRGA